MHLFPIAVILFILVIVSFFFSAVETAIISISKIRLHHMLSQGIKGAEKIHRLVLKLDKVIAAILIGNNFVNITISAIVTSIFVQMYERQTAVIIATLTTTFFLLILCEITPKVLATKHPEQVALITAPIMEVFLKISRPFIFFFGGISNFILKIFGISHGKRSPLITEEELRVMIELGREEGVLTDDERKMLHRIFEFGDIKVKDVMVAKDKMVGVSISATTEELLNIFVEEGHARLPVYAGTKDVIVGIIYARDLLYILRDKGLFLLQDLLHPVYSIPPATKVNEILRKFQTDKIQMAIVVDEQKKTLGMVTLEDLLEEIVGEIEEKYPDYT